MLRNPFTKALWDSRRAILGWGMGIGYASVRDTPASRPRLLVSRLAGLVTAVLFASAVVFLLLLAIAGPTKTSSVGVGHLAAMTVQLALFGILFGALTLAVGAATGRRAAAIAAAVVVLVFG